MSKTFVFHLRTKYISCITINLMYYIISLSTMIIIIDTIDYYMITMHFCLYYPRNKISSVEHNQFNNHHFPPEKYMESIFRLLNTVILVTYGINNANTHFVSQRFPIFFVFYTTATIERSYSLLEVSLIHDSDINLYREGSLYCYKLF